MNAIRRFARCDAADRMRRQHTPRRPTVRTGDAMIRRALLALAIAAAAPSAVFASALEAQSVVSGTLATLNSRCDLAAGQPSTTDADCARRWFDGQLRLND